MLLNKHQIEFPHFTLNASHLCLDKWNWETIKSENKEHAKNLMGEKKYDVLPVELGNNISKFFTTIIWNNYDNIKLSEINSLNSIYYMLSFPDLIKKFTNDNCHFFFLTNYQEVLGIILFNHLNNRLVYRYLYDLIFDLEQSLILFLRENMANDVLNIIQNSKNPNLSRIYKTYMRSKRQGYDNTIFEAFYLNTLGIIIPLLYESHPDKLKELNEFSNKLSSKGTINLLRNKVMHPVNPLVDNIYSVREINAFLIDYQLIKEILT